MAGLVSSHLSNESLLPEIAPNTSTSQSIKFADKAPQKLANRIVQFFHFIWPLKAPQALSERKITPAVEDSQDSDSDSADLEDLAREFEKLKVFFRKQSQPSAVIKNPITKDTSLKKEQVSLAEQTLVDCLYSRNEGKLFELPFMVTDYTVLSYTVFYPECSVVNLECCFSVTSLALEYVARLTNLEVLDLSRCFSTGRGAFWRPAKDDSLDKKTSLLTPLAKCKHLHTLKLSRCVGLEDEDLQDLPSLTQLQCLDLSYCSKLTAKSVELIAQLPRLEKLQLVRCEQLSWEEEALLDLCSKCTTLEEIDCTDMGVYPEFASELVSKMPSVKKGITIGREYPPINTFRSVEERSH